MEGSGGPAGRSKTFRHRDPTQSFLLPSSQDEWLPEVHAARLIAESEDEVLDLSVLYDSGVYALGGRVL